ncbi:MAG: TetR/AcrR family transcriptional regulator [Lachnospiraceae bacterium]|nr:TetR/AcrR family transcriptional regulator [Lachnospiraceae bacterium]
MTKAESKYFHTAKRMDEAFLSLMEKKDFEYITVSEICETAGVNRSTFYLHYETIGDLLSECLEQSNAQFMEYFNVKKPEMEKKIGTASLDELFFITSEFLVPYLTYISEHKTLFRVVLSKPEVMQANKTYDEIFCDVLNPILARYGVREKDRDYMLAFYIEGLMGIVKRWLTRDCVETVDQIAEIMMNVVRR